MLEPSAPLLPPSPAPAAGQGPGHLSPALRLLETVRTRQRRALWLQGGLLALACLVALALAGALVAPSSIGPGRALLALAPLAALAVALFHGLYLSRQRVGTTAQTAQLMAAAMPELSLDLLAAVELSRALGQRHDFSPGLARAFLQNVDQRAARADWAGAVDPMPTVRAAVALATCIAVAVLLVALYPARLERGLVLATQRAQKRALVREPITGDVRLTYRYPAYTGLSPRTVEGTNGEVTALLGTEVTIETRADRDIEAAALDVNGRRLPLQLKGRRELSGTLVLDASGTYHFVFLDGRTVEAEGSDLPIRLEADQAPTARLTSPLPELEVDPGAQAVTLNYDATDDYGVSALELVYQSAGQAEVRVPLTHDDGRTTHGDYRWDLSALHLVPGQRLKYFLEATDNDEVSGKKAGRSQTQTLKLYSEAEHRREAIAKAEVMWNRLVLHLADRMEGNDRLPEKTVTQAEAGEPVDARGTQLALDTEALSQELFKEKDAPIELVTALTNAGNQLQRDVGGTMVRRRLFLRMVATGHGKELSTPLGNAVSNEIHSTEKSVLYLEALLDRVRLKDLRELAEQLRKDRRELADLFEKYKATHDEQTKEQVLQEIRALRERMTELSERIAELAKGIHDEFMNQEALKEMQEQRDLNSALDEIDQLMRDGKVDDAMTRLQELSMQMDDLLKQLDEAADASDENSDPELSKMYEDFSGGLDQLSKDQEALSDKTRALRDKYREQMKETIKRRGQEVKEQVLKRTADLKRDYENLDAENLGNLADKARETALQDVTHLESALKADDFDLSLEAARQLSQSANKLQDQADQQKRLDEMFGNPPDVRKKTRDSSERLGKDSRRAEEAERLLEGLFPQTGQMMSEGDKAQVQNQQAQQKALEQRAQELMQQMENIQQRAPVFDPESEQSLEQAGKRMQGATERLGGKDTSKGYAEQQGALESLKGLQQQMNQPDGKGKGKGKGLPMPMRKRGGGRSVGSQKVEIPDEDPSREPRELRKDVMDAMKQGGPDRYKEQVKKYYEELVK